MQRMTKEYNQSSLQKHAYGAKKDILHNNEKIVLEKVKKLALNTTGCFTKKAT